MLVLVPYVNNQWHTIFYRTETIPSYKFVKETLLRRFQIHVKHL